MIKFAQLTIPIAVSVFVLAFQHMSDEAMESKQCVLSKLRKLDILETATTQSNASTTCNVLLTNAIVRGEKLQSTTFAKKVCAN